MNMDRIKYRYWEHAVWNDPTSPLVEKHTDIVAGCDPTVAVGDFEFCTGLKDKNGNLIYEGDILQNPNKDQYIVEWIVDGYWHIRQIDDEKFGCALASIKTFYDGWEIVGNTHEQKDDK